MTTMPGVGATTPSVLWLANDSVTLSGSFTIAIAV
jgi:hypothetical protein